MHSFALCTVAAYNILVSNTAQHLLVISAFFVWQFLVLWYITIPYVSGANTIKTFCELRNVCVGPNQLDHTPVEPAYHGWNNIGAGGVIRISVHSGK